MLRSDSMRAARSSYALSIPVLSLSSCWNCRPSFSISS